LERKAKPKGGRLSTNCQPITRSTWIISSHFPSHFKPQADPSLHDGFIRMILQHCRNREALLQILGILVVSRRPLMLSEIVDITSVSKDIASVTLCQVNPLVHISSFLDSQWGIRFGSFGSFLTTRHRSGEFFINTDAQHMYLTLRCLEALKDGERYAKRFSLQTCRLHTLV
jgi:hypothetical protein